MARIALIAALCLCVGCASIGQYFEERARDFVDIFDFKVGYGLGIGAKVQFTDFVAIGLGVSLGSEYEKYGRWYVENDSSAFAHIPFFGVDGCFIMDVEMKEEYLGGLQVWDKWRIDHHPAPPVDRLRVGGEIHLLIIRVGLYLNIGQIADFFLGIFGYDLIDDDKRKYGEQGYRVK